MQSVLHMKICFLAKTTSILAFSTGNTCLVQQSHPLLCRRRSLQRGKGIPAPAPTQRACSAVTSEGLRQRPPAAESIPRTPPSSHPVIGELNTNTAKAWKLPLITISFFFFFYPAQDDFFYWQQQEKKNKVFQTSHSRKDNCNCFYIPTQTPTPASDDASTI